MTRLQRARFYASNLFLPPREDELFWWSWGQPFTYAEIHQVAASLTLDGYHAHWPHICWRCAPGWGHNAGGNDNILRHKPMSRAAARRGTER